MVSHRSPRNRPAAAPVHSRTRRRSFTHAPFQSSSCDNPDRLAVSRPRICPRWGWRCGGWRRRWCRGRRGTGRHGHVGRRGWQRRGRRPSGGARRWWRAGRTCRRWRPKAISNNCSTQRRSISANFSEPKSPNQRRCNRRNDRRSTPWRKRCRTGGVSVGRKPDIDRTHCA